MLMVNIAKSCFFVMAAWLSQSKWIDSYNFCFRFDDPILLFGAFKDFHVLKSFKFQNVINSLEDYLIVFLH